jgi:hypothetical protein
MISLIKNLSTLTIGFIGAAYITNFWVWLIFILVNAAQIILSIADHRKKVLKIEPFC